MSISAIPMPDQEGKATGSCMEGLSGPLHSVFAVTQDVQVDLHSPQPSSHCNHLFLVTFHLDKHLQEGMSSQSPIKETPEVSARPRGPGTSVGLAHISSTQLNLSLHFNAAWVSPIIYSCKACL